MIKNIEDFNIKAEMKDEFVTLPDDINSKINEFWKKVEEENPALWDGELVCVDELDIDDKKHNIDIICRKSHYSHYLYNERIGIDRKYSCSSLIAGCIFETSDGYYVIGELSKETSFPGCLQVSGGSTDNDDVSNGHINVINTIKREAKEEVNIDLDDKDLVDNWCIKFIDLPEDGTRLHTYIIFAKADLKISKDDMKKLYGEYLKYLSNNNLEIEFSKLYFINKNKVSEDLNNLDNPKRPYLEKVLIEDSIG